MDRLGTYRGYDIAVTLHSNGERKTPKWHSSTQISPVGRVATEPCFTTEPSYSTVSEARTGPLGSPDLSLMSVQMLRRLATTTCGSNRQARIRPFRFGARLGRIRSFTGRA